MADEKRTLSELISEQNKIDRFLSEYHKGLIARAKAIGNGDGDAAAEIVEEMKKCKVGTDEYRHWWNQYNDMMQHAKEIAAAK